MLELTDLEILKRLTNVEDSTVERKTSADYRDSVKAAVAFSNSLPVGDPGVIFVGVYDDGRIEEKTNLESLQLKVSAEIGRVYPPIYPQIMVKRSGENDFLAVVVRGSENRPHFAGQSFIRDGTQSKVASETQFETLVSQRNSKAYAILRWKDRQVTVENLNTEETVRRIGRVANTTRKTIRECNQFWVTLEDPNNSPRLESIPLRRIELAYDHNSSCLKFEVYPL
jgi:predicted HTH transcriptional regulator